MSALANGGNYDVCSCSECSGFPKVDRTFLYYNPIKNILKLYKRNKNGWYGFINKNGNKIKGKLELCDFLIGQYDE